MRRRRVRQLFGESLREAGILVGVFVPLDFSIEGTLTGGLILLTVVLGGILLICGIFLETAA